MKEWMRKPLYGVGVNDSDYVTQPSMGERCPYFDKWASMLRRCYAGKHAPSYKDCEVCDEWLTFSNFKNWMQSKNWEGLDLDKDILVRGNRIYSEETCVFIPPFVNLILFGAGNKQKKSNLPLGVVIKPRLKTNPYAAQGTLDGKRLHLGVRSTPLEAHMLWQKWRLDSIYKITLEYRTLNCYDERVDKSICKLMDDIRKCIEDKRIVNSIMEF